VFSTSVHRLTEMHLSDFVKSFHLLNKLIAKDETKRNETKWKFALSQLRVEGSNLGCTGVENPGEGVAQIFAWGSRLSGQNCARGAPYFGFYCVFIKSFFLVCLERGGVVLCYTPFFLISPPLPPCVHLWIPPTLDVEKNETEFPSTNREMRWKWIAS
jgi:hypothetical protein